MQHSIQRAVVLITPLTLVITAPMVTSSMSPSNVSLTTKVASILLMCRVVVIIPIPSGFDDSKLADAIFAHFGPGTVYEKVRTQSESPKKGPWTNHCIKIFIANRENEDKPEADSSSKDPDGTTKAVAVTALLAGKDGLMDQVKKCVNTAQVSNYS